MSFYALYKLTELNQVLITDHREYKRQTKIAGKTNDVTMEKP